jgi:transposase
MNPIENTFGTESPGEAMLEPCQVQALLELHRVGWTIKAISRELGWSRNTVKSWLKRGLEAPRPRPGRPNALDGHSDWIRERFLHGIRNADVLRQELAAKGVAVCLRTVERAVEALREDAVNLDRATLRFETEPGRQLQIDFGEKWVEVAGVRVKAYLFVATLGYSRRLFAQVHPGLRQHHWLGGLEAALRHFGGAPDEVLVDNAKALVLRWEGDRAIFHPEFEAFCRHWGMKPRACRPYRPRTKGKVENGVRYVKANALCETTFETWDALEGHLAAWLREVADRRVHGTTHEKPEDRFERERPHLHALGNHPSYMKVRRLSRKVTGDCRVEVDTHRYSVPFHLVGQTVEVEIQGEFLTVRWKGEAVAQHAVPEGRYGDIQDPRHLDGLVQKTYRLDPPHELQRPLSDYQAAAGGETW